MPRNRSAILVPLTIAVGVLVAGSYAVAANRYIDRLDIAAEISPLAVKSNLTAITRAGDAYITVGERGHILRSIDQGKSWIQSPAPLSAPLTAISFPTAQKGWAVGQDGVVLHSEDGGKHWERQIDGRQVGNQLVDYYEKQPPSNDPNVAKAQTRALDDAKRFQQEGSNQPFLDVYFENEKSGWVIGTFNLILKTTDGGKTWEPWLDRTDNDNGYSLHALTLVDGDVYLVGELGLLLKLDRQKERFTALKSPYNGSLFGIAGKPGTVLIYGLRGNMFRSRDKGNTWQALRLNLESALVGAAYLGDGPLVVVSNKGGVFISKDDGESFAPLAVTQKGWLSDVAPVDENSVLVVGANGVNLVQIK